MEKIMKYIFAIILGLLIAFIAGCDIIEAPYKENVIVEKDTAAKNVLIEDFTGFRCGNCPEAGEKARDIAETYQGKVFIMSIHAKDLAVPTPFRKYEFRTPEGTDIATHFNLPATPYGMVNRVPVNGNALLAPDAWGTSVAQQLTKKADLKMALNVGFNEGTKTISLETNMKFVNDSKTSYFMAAYIVEDSIIQYQRDDRNKTNPDILNFVHMHVLRGSMNGTWGTQISSDIIKAKDSIKIVSDFTIPAEKDWVPKNLSLIVIVQDNDTKEIKQVDKIKIIKE
jgi:hypothetical protein